MILDKVIQAIAAFVAWLISLIPTVPGWPGGSIGSDVAALISLVSSPMAALDYYIPLHEMLAVAGACIAAETALAIWAVVRFALMLVRGVH